MEKSRQLVVPGELAPAVFPVSGIQHGAGWRAAVRIAPKRVK